MLLFPWICFIYGFISTSAKTIENNVVVISKEEQLLLHNRNHNQCLTDMSSQPPPNITGAYCNRTWDNLMCWPDTPAGVTINQSCPHYNCFKLNEFASRECLEDGTWYISPVTNKSWTNYTSCMSSHVLTQQHTPYAIFQEHLSHISLMYNIGYWLSFISLVVAVIIMAAFKRLHCARNTVHIHLFVSFILRALLSLLRDNLLVNGIAFQQDLHTDACGNVSFRQNALHWECRLLMSLFNYVCVANYAWIFVEGLYLNMLIFVSVFSEKSGIYGYILIGWASPLLSIVPWVIVRATLENVYCWNTHPTPAYFWLIKGPILLIVIVNFIFFLNIVRVLLTKLRAPNTAEERKYRKLAKSTLVLIPLFGVHYIIFSWVPTEGSVNQHVELVSLYFEMFFNSFQGFLVAIIFCFCNGEVQMELRKKWQRYQLRRGSFNQSSKWNTLTSYVPRAQSVDKTSTAGGEAVPNADPVDHKNDYGEAEAGLPTNATHVTLLDDDQDNMEASERTRDTIICDEEIKPIMHGESTM